ncbi:TolC family protein [Raineya orbicola]|uniref:Outer membrane efflux protein n=1 Tax=Raineya orbicola TaxID=2016530 RepID=A0A2N3I8K2_9BACT|nr:TolC family protein [Raineya orbicola]PKQ66563.1 Outer membrane efflux protein [Raineya orbicola]
MKKFLFLICSITSFSVFAQERWSLQKCVNYAIENNISIKQRQLQVESSTENLQQSRESRFAPQLSASLSQAMRTGRSIDPFTNQFVTQNVFSTNISLNGSIVLFNGFGTINTIKQNETTLKANQLDVEQAKRDISLNVANAYLQLLLAQELEQASLAQVEITKNQLERTEKLFKAGSVAEVQVLNLKSQLANDEVNVITARNQVSLARLNLLQQMNMPATQNIEIEKVEVATLINEYANKNPQEIYDTAEKNQYNIQSADLRIESLKYNEAVARSALYPTLTLGVGINSAYSSAAPSELFRPDGTSTLVQVPIGYVGGSFDTVYTIRAIPNGKIEPNRFFNQMDFNRSSFIVLNLNIPLYSQGRTRNSITQSRIQQKNQKYQADLLRQQLRQAIEQAYNDMKLAQSNFEARQKQVEALELNFKAVESRFNAGASNAVDYNLAKLNLDQAKAQLIRTKYEYLFRIKVLDFYMNKPIELR